MNCRSSTSTRATTHPQGQPAADRRNHCNGHPFVRCGAGAGIAGIVASNRSGLDGLIAVTAKLCQLSGPKPSRNVVVPFELVLAVPVMWPEPSRNVLVPLASVVAVPMVRLLASRNVVEGCSAFATVAASSTAAAAACPRFFSRVGISWNFASVVPHRATKVCGFILRCRAISIVCGRAKSDGGPMFSSGECQ